jgi:hypothetical protein
METRASLFRGFAVMLWLAAACQSESSKDTPGGSGTGAGATGAMAGSGATTGGSASGGTLSGSSGSAATGAAGLGGTAGVTAGTAGSANLGGTGATSGSSSGGGAAGTLGTGGTAGTGTGASSGMTPGGAGGTAGSATAGSGGGQSAPVDQTMPGTKPALVPIQSFDGLAVGNPTDLSLAVGPNHVVQVVNWSMAVYSKTGMTMRGPVSSNSVFAGAGGRCQAGSGDSAADRGDVIVRYDQLAQRWVFVQPVFRAPYAMCYAVSDSADPLGTYHHYEFARTLFPDYPRLGIWPDGYYLGSSTGDDVVQKHICVANRARMLAGQTATEQCVTKNDVNFLNPADLDGMQMPPAGAPNLVLALGGTQLRNVFEDDGVYAYKFHVDWTNTANTTFTGPTKVTVARYHYLCNGQLSSCVTQPNTTQRLDAQGDKLMQRVSYRNFGDHQSIVVTHSVNGPSGGGGLRWYELRINANGDPELHQQSTYAPDTSYRWLGSAAIDRNGNIGIGFSYGGAPAYAGQRFVARAAADPLGVMTHQESILATGQASQTSTLRWEDYSTTVLDPSDDTTFWYVGNYLKTGSTTPATRIGAFRVP